MMKFTSGRLTLVAAFASIYLIWGSTYLAIVFAIETMPPFLMLGARFLVAGLLVYLWCLWRGTARVSGKEWRNAIIVGTLTLSAGTGAVAWAEQWVPSGAAALLVTTVPMWMVLLEWRWKGGARPNAYVWWGLVLGLLGIILLVSPQDITLGGDALVGSLAILLAAICFSTGAILGRDMGLPKNVVMSSATQMIGAGVSLVLFGLLVGEGEGLSITAISGRSWLALAYLMVFGSIVAYGSFVWLMKNSSPARVSTYAYVNPVVAVFLGWLLAGEVVDARVILAVVVLVSAVVLITRFGGPSRRSRLRSGTLGRQSRRILSAFAHSLDRPATSLGTGRSRALEQARG